METTNKSRHKFRADRRTRLDCSVGITSFPQRIDWQWKQTRPAINIYCLMLA